MSDTGAGGFDRSEGSGARRHTFDSICGRCGALLPNGCGQCLVCGAGRDDTPYTGEFPIASEPLPSPAYPGRDEARRARRTPRVLRRWGAGVSAVILLAVMVLGGLGLYRQYFDMSAYRAEEAFVYEGESGRLLLSYPGLGRPKEITGIARPKGGFTQGGLRASPNGRWIAYTAQTGELYMLDLAQRGIADTATFQAKLLARDVAEPAVFSYNSDYLVYHTSGGELYASDLAESWRLDTGVLSVAAVNGRKVLYTRRGDQEGQTDLYLHNLPKGSGEWLLIERNVTEVLDWTENFSRLLYTGVRADEDGKEVASLQLFEAGGSVTTTIATGMDQVLDASAEQGTALYLVPRKQRWSYEDFINDDMALRDRKLTEPDLEEFPLVREAFDLYGEGGDFTDIEENETLIEELNRYRIAQTAWEEKLARDQLRQELYYAFATMKDPLVLGDLYAYQNGAQTLLDTGVWQEGDLTPQEGRVSAEKGFVVYEKISPSTLKKLLFSELWAKENLREPAFDLREYFLNNVRRELMHTQIGGSSVRMYLRSAASTYYQWRVSPGGDGVYFTLGPIHNEPEGAATLYYAPIRGGVPADAVLVEQQMTRIAWPLRDGVVFERGTGQSRTLSFARGGESRALGGESAQAFEPVNDGDTFFYLDGFDPSADAGTLYMLAKEERALAADVSGFVYQSDDLVYFFRWNKNKDGKDLYLWQAGRETLLDRNMHGMLGMPLDTRLYAGEILQ